MEPVDPCVPLTLLPEGCRAAVIAKDQPEYVPLPSILTPEGAVITRWQLSQEERQHIAEGGDLYLTLLTFGRPMQPVLLTIAPPDLRHA